MFGVCGESNVIVSVCNGSAAGNEIVATYQYNEAQSCLNYGDPACALQNQLVLLDFIVPCEDSTNTNTLAFNNFVNQTLQLFELYLNASNGVLADMTSLLGLWNGIAMASCEPLPEMLEILLQICLSDNLNGAMSSSALNSLFGTIFSSPLTEDQYFEYLDKVLEINDCFQERASISSCGVKLPINVTTSNFAFTQSVVSLAALSNGFSIELTAARYDFPAEFDKQIALAYEKQFNTTLDNFCVIYNIISARRMGGDGNTNLSADLSGMTVRYVGTNELGNPVNEELKLDAMMGVNVTFDIPECAEDSENSVRYSLAITIDNNYSVTYYVGGQSFSNDGIANSRIINNCFVSASVEHFSNLALLFSSSSADDWTTYRIVSLALLLGVWLFLAIFFLLLQFSPWFRKTFGLMSTGEMADRQLSKIH